MSDNDGDGDGDGDGGFDKVVVALGVALVLLAGALTWHIVTNWH